MPRTKKQDPASAKTRSRMGCWPCKSKKIKCGEEKPKCVNCERAGEKCDYSIRLNWDGRAKKREGEAPSPGSDLPTPGSSAASPTSTSAQTSALNSPALLTSPSQQSASTASGGYGYRASPSDHAQWSGYFPTSYDTSFPSQSQFPAQRLSTTPSYPYQSTYPPAAESERYSQEAKRKRTESDVGQPILYSQPLPTTSAYEFQDRYYATHGDQQPFEPYYTPRRAIDVSSAEYAGHLPFSNPQDPAMYQTSAHFRRLSVRSLLSETSQAGSGGVIYAPLQSPEPATVYGYDRGRADKDLPANNDAHALSQPSPVAEHERGRGEQQNEFGFGLRAQEFRHDKQEYYAQPVAVTIPVSLEPLPRTLQENRMNLLYFHHFLNHTARILVPHDCPENPFRNILPQLAVRNDNLLKLLLAYAASHRARLLNHRDPVNRIAMLLRDVFSHLRHDLENRREHMSDANLATAIMLASMEIVTPNAFEVPVPWRTHLDLAARIIAERGGYASLRSNDADKVPFFLSRWFAYLDVMGKLSGSNYNRPALFADPSAVQSPGSYEHDPAYDDQDSEIDCLMGFTNRCIVLLAKVADLARLCDTQRAGLDDAGRRGWRAAPELLATANKLRSALLEAPESTFRGCVHQRRFLPFDVSEDTSAVAAAESREMDALNGAYHLAGLIHLQRRVYNLPPSHPAVQRCVAGILAALEQLRPGGTAEACMVFPIFTAGCEAIRPADRTGVLQRFQGVEASGLSQVGKARRLMQRVWATGRAWEVLAQGEFVG